MEFAPFRCNMDRRHRYFRYLTHVRLCWREKRSIRPIAVRTAALCRGLITRSFADASRYGIMMTHDA